MSDNVVTFGRYALFAYDDYYPRGGWTDFRGSFPVLPSALAAADMPDNRYDCQEIVDLFSQKVVLERSHGHEWVEVD
jgi:hypothetical protein